MSARGQPKNGPDVAEIGVGPRRRRSVQIPCKPYRKPLSSPDLRSQQPTRTREPRPSGNSLFCGELWHFWSHAFHDFGPFGTVIGCCAIRSDRPRGFGLTRATDIILPTHVDVTPYSRCARTPPPR